MGTQVDGFFKTFTFASAISAYRAVQPTSTAGQAQAAVTGGDSRHRFHAGRCGRW